MNLDFRPVRVATGSDDEEGLLAFAGERLVAVLVRLSNLHDDMAGSWFVEASFGLRDEHQTFTDLPSAEAWIRKHVSARFESGSGATR
jgi:hypothetical protein